MISRLQGERTSHEAEEDEENYTNSLSSSSSYRARALIYDDSINSGLRINNGFESDVSHHLKGIAIILPSHAFASSWDNPGKRKNDETYEDQEHVEGLSDDDDNGEDDEDYEEPQTKPPPSPLRFIENDGKKALRHPK